MVSGRQQARDTAINGLGNSVAKDRSAPSKPSGRETGDADGSTNAYIHLLDRDTAVPVIGGTMLARRCRGELVFFPEGRS